MTVRRAEHGQSTVELALSLPLLVLLLLALLQTALVARDEVLVTHAARAAVREASVGSAAARVRGAATHVLPGAKVAVRREGAANEVGVPIEVSVVYVSHTDVPLVGPLYPDVTLHGRAVMRAER